MPRTKGRKVKTDEEIKVDFDNLAAELKQAGHELIIRREPTKELVSFDVGLMFTRKRDEKGAQLIHVYVDPDVQLVIDQLLVENEQVIVKANWFSPDVVVVTVPTAVQEGSGQAIKEKA